MVRTIIGRPSTRDTNRARKGYARQAVAPHQVNNVNHRAKIPRLSEEPITFTEEEEDQGLIYPHKDAIVVNLKIASQKVHRILIDNGSSVDILLSATLDWMNLISHTFTPIYMPLYGFSRESDHTEGELDLPVELGDTPCQHVQSVKFLAVNCQSIYSVIIGRRTLNAIHTVTIS